MHAWVVKLNCLCIMCFQRFCFVVFLNEIEKKKRKKNCITVLFCKYGTCMFGHSSGSLNLDRILTAAFSRLYVTLLLVLVFILENPQRPQLWTVDLMVVVMMFVVQLFLKVTASNVTKITKSILSELRISKLHSLFTRRAYKNFPYVLPSKDDGCIFTLIG